MAEKFNRHLKILLVRKNFTKEEKPLLLQRIIKINFIEIRVS
jgi:hypothetical protein